MHKVFRLVSIVLFFTFILTLSANAQGNPPIIPPGCDNPVPGIKNPNCSDEVPLNGAEWVVVIGLAYGSYRIYKRSESLKIA